MSKNDNRKMPSQKVIYRFWHEKGGKEILKNYAITVHVQQDVEGKVKIDCFACGSTLDIQRCHIQAKSTGGSDDESNLHLLCAKCHIESEMLSGERYWVWLKNMTEEHWMPFTEHIYSRRQKIGYSDLKAYEIYRQSGISGLLEYMAFFESESQEQADNFKAEILEKMKKLDQKISKNIDE